MWGRWPTCGITEGRRGALGRLSGSPGGGKANRVHNRGRPLKGNSYNTRPGLHLEGEGLGGRNLACCTVGVRWRTTRQAPLVFERKGNKGVELALAMTVTTKLHSHFQSIGPLG